MSARLRPRLRGAAAGAAVRLPATWLAPVLRLAQPDVRAARPLPPFARDDGSLLPRLDGYRERGKGGWRKYWWAPRLLLELDERGLLPAAAREAVDELRAARTLPSPLAEYAALAGRVAEEFPEHVRAVGRDDERLGVPMLAVAPDPRRIRSLADAYLRGGRQVTAAFAEAGVDLPRARLLEVGCGHGYTALALADAGAGEVVGVDLDLHGQVPPEEVHAMRMAVGGGRDVTLETADVRVLPYPEASFDATFSIAVLEHVDDLRRAFAELHRVTCPGGIGYHGIDVWFGPAGGHSLCTLDAPWGHVRLTEPELERYVSELRPHEAQDAIDMYRHAFQRPRRTLTEAAAEAEDAGFEILYAALLRLPLVDPHRAWLDRALLPDCRRVFPSVRPADLLAVTGTLVLRRR